MKSRGTSSHDGLAQEIAVSIVDKNEGTPAVSPLIRNAETRKDAWLDTPTPTNISPTPSEEQGDFDNDSKNLPTTTTSTSSERNIADPSGSPITTSVLDTTGAAETPVTLSRTPPSINAAVEDASYYDEEAGLLAELEAERQAEEKARQKRRELEDRLANARGKKLQRSASAAAATGPERVGSTGDQVETAAETIQTIEDSTSNSLF